VGLHGPHSGTPATIESITQPDPRAGRMEMSVTALVRYGAFYGPNIELRRTITSTLGENVIDVRDEFFNAGNEPQPHQWLLHINFGYPLLQDGAEFCYDAAKVEPLNDPATLRHFGQKNGAYKRVPAPLKEHHGPNSFVAYLYPKATNRNGDTTVAVVNKKLGFAAAIHYNTREFPRCGNWQHWGKREYVGALEPMTGGVEGRDKDRERGWLQTLDPDQQKTYRYRIEIVSDKARLNELLALNRK
jgi:hypothetical protein